MMKKTRVKVLFLLPILTLVSAPCSAISKQYESCILASAAKYRINPDLIKAVIEAESSGKAGIVTINKNKSNDFGLMGINSVHLDELKKTGITREQLINNPCVNIETGSWMLAKHLHKAPPTAQGFWQAVGNYHSKTKKLNSTYQKRVWSKLQHIRARN